MYIFLDYDGTLSLTDEKTYSMHYFKLLSEYSKLPFEKLLNCVFEATDFLIRKPDGINNNLNRFFKIIEGNFDLSKDEWEKLFLSFYSSNFENVKEIIKINEKLVKAVKNSNHKLVFASNPVFPEIAVKKRIEMIGMDMNDFHYISTMENSYFTKPHKEYFDNVLNEIKVDPSNCIMIGDTDFDKASEKAGINFFHVDEEEKWMSFFK
jgi:HAD superfamily hydrolase (TIGR01549 family)